MNDLAERVAVVTGAGSGIGRALALAFSARAMRVLALDVDEVGLAETVSGASASRFAMRALRCDVTVPEDLARAASAAYDLGDVAVLCNNAGVGTPPSRPLWETPLADWNWILDVNLLGVVHGVRAFIPRMIAAGRSAHVVNTSSMAGLYAPPFLGPYVASKHAVVGLSEQLQRELRLAGAPIGVSVVCPLFVNTRILEAERNRGARYAAKDSVALDPAGAEQIRAALAAGQPPAEIASCVVAAIRDDRFLVLCDAPSYEMARLRSALIDGGSPICDDTIVADKA